MNLLRRLLGTSTDDRVLYWCPLCRSSVQPSLLRRRSCRCGWQVGSPRAPAMAACRFDLGLRQERPAPIRRGELDPIRLESEVHPIVATSSRATPPLLPPVLREQDPAIPSR